MKKSGFTILLAAFFSLSALIIVPVTVAAAETDKVEIDILGPRVITASPSDRSCIGSSDGKTIESISIEFSEEVYLDEELSYKNITFVDESRKKIEFKLEKSEDYYSMGKEILLKPVNPLEYNTVYIINLLDNFVQDGDANPSKPYQIRFITQAKDGEVSRYGELNWDDIGRRFSDVRNTHWAYEAILYMADTGVISGYPDGRFRPNESVTREEFAKMMVEALDLPVDIPEVPTFKDVDADNWSYKYVEAAKRYLSGVTTANGFYYRGTQNAMREDIAFALAEAKGYAEEKVDINSLSNIFKDADKISSEKRQHVLIAYEKNLISGYSDKTFRPKGAITRAEAAQVLYNVLFPYSDDNGGERGNTIGNIVNGGMIAGEDGWLYFANRGDSCKLYKMKEDGTEKIKLDDLSCKYINVVDGWIYFISDEQASAPIYKMKTDGTEKTDVGNDAADEMTVVGSWIYYSTGRELLKIRTDGTHKTLLNAGLAYNMNVVGDWIYYNGGNSGSTYKIKTNGDSNTLLNYGSSICMNVVGDFIYYVDFNSDQRNIYRMKTDGTDNKAIGVRAKEVNNSLNVLGDWIYYLEEPETLYKVKVDGTGRTKMAENAFGDICIINDWIYFTVQNSQDMHKINIDGTGRSSILN